MQNENTTLSVLIVDDEPPARARLRELLADIAPVVPVDIVGEADNGVAALTRLGEHPADVVITDIRMPRMDGIELAQHLGNLHPPPGIIFATAYDVFAVQAFDLNAIDYLLKPVRAQRLQTALQKAGQAKRPDGQTMTDIGQAIRGGGRTHLSSLERGRLLLVPLDEILYFKADLKYVTARTQQREYLLDETLTHLEVEFADRFIRLHRAVLVCKNALSGLEKATGSDTEAYGWALLRGVPDKLPVSRRLWGLAKSFAKGV